MKDDVEVWRPVVGYEDVYAVSSIGNVKNIIRDRILSPRLQRGYSKITLNKKDKRINTFVHRLVAHAFISPNDPRPVNHINGIRNDNRIENLEFISYRENNTHSKTKTKYKTGVWRCPNGFRSGIHINKKLYCLGTYWTEDEAHQAYLRVLKFLGMENKYAG